MTAVTSINSLGACAHNPRGDIWYNDQNTFGQKILMKMGWTKGKGLGKNEDGIKENVKVKFRNTNSGLGYKHEAFTNIMKTEYESILRNLNAEYSQNTSTVNEVNGYENTGDAKKSRVIKGKPRYSKLFVGKDVSKYSAKDMKCIFICSQPMKTDQNDVKESASTKKQEPEIELPKMLQTYSSELSISDYFTKKMKGKKSQESSVKLQQQKLNSDSKLCRNFSSTESDTTISQKCGNSKSNSKRKHTDVSNVHEAVSNLEIAKIRDDTNTKESTKKKRKFSDISKDKDNTDVLDNSNRIDLTSSNSRKSKKSKKKRMEDRYELNDKLEVSGETAQGADYLIAEFKKNQCNSKEIRSKTKKKTKLKKLRSCLRSKSDKYDVKCVSFNENVSYKIIDSDYEFVDSVADSVRVENQCEEIPDPGDESKSKPLDKTSEKKLNETFQFNIVDTCLVEKPTEIVDKNRSDDNCNKSFESKTKWTADQTFEDLYPLSNFPSSNSSYYNGWIGNQKQALKMRMYKNMLQRLQKHEILNSTNLLSIKGYGNWGF